MKNILSLLVFTLAVQFGFSQIKFEERIEFEINDGFVSEKFHEMGEVGVIVSSRSSNSSQGNYTWRFQLYDTELVSVWSENLEIDNSYIFDETASTENSLHNFYRNRKGEFIIVSLEPLDREVTEVVGAFPKKTIVQSMQILGEYAFFKGEIKGSPYLFAVNWRTGKQKIVPIQIDNFKSKKIVIKDYQVLEDEREVFVFLQVFYKKNLELHIIQLNEKSEKTNQYHFTDDIDKNIMSISVSKTDNGKYIFTGTYNSLSKNKISAGDIFSSLLTGRRGSKSARMMSSSEGLFFCEAQNNEISFVQYYNWLELANFLSYLSDRKQGRIEKKNERKKAKGKQLTYNYLIADHDVQFVEDGYIFLGEAYYPTYRTEYYTSYQNGVSVNQSRTVFDGYQYTHAVVAKFGFNGELIWDETFEMFPAEKPYRVKRFISTPDNLEDALYMVFSSNGRIITKAINFDGIVIENKASEKILTDDQNDTIKYTTSNLDYWYGDYFLAFGFQKIKNKEEAKRKDRKRKVYYMTKIAY